MRFAVGLRGVVLAGLVAVLVAPVCVAQAADVTTPMPKDPAAILSLGARANGLGEPGLQPWHVKASYKTYDDAGKPNGDGTFEMFWDGPQKYKQVFTSAAFTQTEYGTANGVYRVGDAGSVPYPQHYVMEQILHPVPSQQEIDEAAPYAADREFQQTMLTCVMLSQKDLGLAAPPLGLFPTYCFPQGKPVLRFSSYGDGVTVLFNKIALFQGRYFAGQIDVIDGKRSVASVTVDTVGALGAVQDAFFEPPAGSVRLAGTDGMVAKTDPGSGVTPGKIIHSVEPPYPLPELSHRVTGTVTLSVVVGRDGRVHRMKVVTSPSPNFSLAALVAASQYQFSPFTQNGVTVDAQIKIQMQFRLY